MLPLPAAQLARQPRRGETPVPHHRLRRDLQHICRFVHGQPAEESQLDHLRTPGIDPGQRLEGLIELNERRGARIGGSDLIEIHGRSALGWCCAAPTFLRAPGPGGVHEDAAHQLRRQREEVRAIGPARDPHVDQTQIRLVNERGALQRQPGALAPYVAARLRAQLGVDERRELLERALVSLAPGFQQARDIRVIQPGHAGGLYALACLPGSR